MDSDSRLVREYKVAASRLAFMSKAAYALLSAFAFAVSLPAVELEYAPVAGPNPLKGLVPPFTPRLDLPQSLGVANITVRSVMIGRNEFDWTWMERLLDGGAKQGWQTIIRPVLSMPYDRIGFPNYILDIEGAALRFEKRQGSYPQDSIVPVYNHPEVLQAMRDFIKAFGQKYDGDPRIAFIEAGLLGPWGEWLYGDFNRDLKHLWASEETEIEVTDAYEKAFDKTIVLLRWPTPKNVERPFGYHDDWFAHKNGEYRSKLTNPDLDITTRWLKHPMGGRIHPEYELRSSHNPPQTLSKKLALETAEKGHYSWLWMREKIRIAEPDTLRELDRRLGYEFHVKRFTSRHEPSTGQLHVSVTITNTGIAPFYYPWGGELALFSEGRIVKTWPTNWDITKIIPTKGDIEFESAIEGVNSMPKDARLLLRIVNPMKSGLPVLLANKTQNADLPGWLTLGAPDLK